MSSESLDQLYTEKTQILPWIWIIEGMASTKPMVTSHLLQLAKLMREKCEELGINAREAVSRRILEALASTGDTENSDNISGGGERIQFDPSESCEDVLQLILVDVENNGGQKMLKWDIQSFIDSKRARLNTCSSQKLKPCIKCNNEGQVLLVCSSDTCKTVVHESCLGSPVNLDREGQFYCPFCVYSRAVSETFEARTRAILARENLTIFLRQKFDSSNSTKGSEKSKSKR